MMLSGGYLASIVSDRNGGVTRLCAWERHHEPVGFCVDVVWRHFGRAFVVQALDSGGAESEAGTQACVRGCIHIEPKRWAV